MNKRYILSTLCTLGLVTSAHAGLFDELNKLNKKVENVHTQVQETTDTVQEAKDTASSAEETAKAIKNVNSVEGAAGLLGQDWSASGLGSGSISVPPPSGLPKLATGYDIFGVDLGYYNQAQLDEMMKNSQLANYIKNPNYKVTTQGRKIEGSDLYGLVDVTVIMREDVVCSDLANKAINKYSTSKRSRLDVASGSKSYTWGGKKAKLGKAKNVEKKKSKFIKKANKLFNSNAARLVGKTDKSGDGREAMFEINCKQGITNSAVFKLSSSNKLNAINQYNAEYLNRQRKVNASAAPDL